MTYSNQAYPPDWLGLTTALVSAYISNNRVALSELPEVIARVHASLAGLGHSPPEEPKQRIPLTPAQVRKSIRPDGLLSFEDGRSYKMLRRHLKQHGLTPATYRTKWGLPDDYPMTAPGYSAIRSDLAKAMQLGQQRRRRERELLRSPSQ